MEFRSQSEAKKSLVHICKVFMIYFLLLTDTPAYCFFRGVGGWVYLVGCYGTCGFAESVGGGV